MPADIDFDLDAQEELAKRIAKYAGELSDVRIGPASAPGEFVWDNGTFGGGDGYAYYGLVRELRPRRVIEVGAGSSRSCWRGRWAQTATTPRSPWSSPSPSRSGQLSAPDWRIVTSIAQDADLTMFKGSSQDFCSMTARIASAREATSTGCYSRSFPGSLQESGSTCTTSSRRTTTPPRGSSMGG